MKGRHSIFQRCGRAVAVAWRCLRFGLTLLSLLLLLITLAAWLRGYRSWDRLTLCRESLDAREWRQREWFFDVGGGDVGMVVWSNRAEPANAREAGLVPGTRWLSGASHLPSQSVRKEQAEHVRFLTSIGARTSLSESGGVLRASVEWKTPVYSYVCSADVTGGRARGWWFSCPCWMAAILFALLPAQRVYAWARRRRTRHLITKGMCPQCGYDLRATPDPNGPRLARCPECGREVARPDGAAEER